MHLLLSSCGSSRLGVVAALPPAPSTLTSGLGSLSWWPLLLPSGQALSGPVCHLVATLGITHIDLTAPKPRRVWVGPCDIHSPYPFPLCEQVSTPKAAPPKSVLLPRSGSLSPAVRAVTSLPPLSLSRSLDPSCLTTARERLYRTKP